MGKAEDSASNLHSNDLEVRRGAARFIKNAIIGNKTKKRLYTNLGVIRRLIEMFSSDTDEGIIIQSAAAIGSFACGTDESILAVNEAGAANLLLKALTHPNQKVVETVARSLKIVFLSKHCNRSIVFEGETVKLIPSLLHHPNDMVKEVAATIVAKSCDEESDRRSLYLQHGALDALVKLLSGNAKTQEVSIEAIASLSRDNEEVCKQIALRDEGALMETITKLTKDVRPRTRLAATSIIANLNQSKTLPPRYHNLTKTIIPIIIRLFVEETASEDAPQVLARLVGSNEDLQIIATEAEAVPKLGTLLHSAISDRQRESVLSALANISSQQDECRKQIIDHKLLSVIVGLLGSTNVGVRAAACRCTRSLSRSIKQLRTSLVDAGVAAPLFKLLDDKSLEVQIEASATLCNIVLDFSPLKKEVMDNGGLSRLISLLSSMDSTLRLNALWALKNLAYDADLSLKQAIMNELKYEGLYELMFDPDFSIQEQALALVRNFVFRDADAMFSTEDKVAELLNAVERVIDAHRNNPRTGVLMQALYLVSNLATGGDGTKQAIVSSKIAASLPHFMEHRQGIVRVASVWCATNLGWPDDTASNTSSDVSHHIVEKLREIGVEEKLMSMTNDPDMDVRDRVNSALPLLENSADVMSD